MTKLFRSNKAKWIAVVVVGILLTGGLISVAQRVGDVETTKTLGSSAYSIGLLDDATGKVPSEDDADNGGVRTTKFYKLDGLKCEMATGAEIKYQVNYYDENKNFLAVQTLTADFDSANIPSEATDAEYVKIEIIPTADDDGTVSWTEVSGYVSQLSVTVAK